jgi:putative ABC transport system permease protein
MRLAPRALGVALAAGALAAAVAGAAVSASGSAGAEAEADAPARADVGERLARRLALAPGDTIEIRASPTRPGSRLVVNAIVPDAADPSRIADRPLSAVLELPDLASLLGTGDVVDRIALRAPPGVSAESLAAAVNSVAQGFQAYTTDEVARRSSRAFVVIERFHEAISLITIVGGGVFVVAILLIKTAEVRHGVGMLRCIGVSRRTLLLAILWEALALSVIGAAAGIALGRAIAVLVNLHYQRYYDTGLVFARVTARSAWTAVGVSLALGIGSSLVAGWRMLREAPLRLLGR